MEKDSSKTNYSTTDVTTGNQDDFIKSDSDVSIKIDRPRKTSEMMKEADPPRKLTMPASGLAIKKRAVTFKSLVKSPQSQWLWKTHKGLVFGLSNSAIKPTQKIAMFDMDGTLIINRTCRRATDWEFVFPSIPEKLRELSSQGFRIVIASNQLGVSLNLVSEKDLQKKVEQFISVIGIEATVMLAIKNDKFRKPETGMWGFLENFLNTTPIDRDQCVNFLDLVLCWRFCRPSCFRI